LSKTGLRNGLAQDSRRRTLWSNRETVGLC